MKGSAVRNESTIITTLDPRTRTSLWIVRMFLVVLVAIPGGSLLPCSEALSANVPQSQPSKTRRNVLQQTAGWVTLGSVGGMMSPIAAVTADDANNNNKPIAILGASGRTGALCVVACLSQGLPVRACTRTGTWMAPSLPIPGLDVDPSLLSNANSKDTNNNLLLDVRACNVQDPDALLASIQGCRAVIYAASASKQGGSPTSIDDVGAVAAAQACCAAGVPQYILISSTATTRPQSLGYRFTNVFSSGGIMDAKRRGELGVTQVYRDVATQNGNDKDCSFTIIRPGGLEEPKRNAVLGPSALEVSQGDVLAGVISRADLAVFSVALATSNANCRRNNLHSTALKLYYTESVTPVEGKFAKLLQTNAAPRYHGSTYGELFQQVQPYVDYYYSS